MDRQSVDYTTIRVLLVMTNLFKPPNLHHDFGISQ